MENRVVNQQNGSGKKTYDVFISYRRDKGTFIARNLQQALTIMGLKVFFDMEELTDGKFNEKLYEAIEQSKNVVFLMTDGALERCSDENDWVRLELEHALNCGINFIPVAPTGVDIAFPDWFPEPLKGISQIEVSELNLGKLFNESVAKIASRFKEIVLVTDREKVEAEEVFSSRARRFKANDGIIDDTERAKLDELADNLGISMLRRESLIERIECEQARTVAAAQRAVLDKMAYADITHKDGKERFHLMSPDEITPQDIQEVLDMEAEVYPEDERQPLSFCIQYFEVNPNVYLFFKDMDTGKIVANIDICPISDECYEMIRSGTFRDREILPDMVLSYDLPSLYNLYFEGITIRPAYRNTGLFLFMFNSLVKMFLSLGEREIYAQRMIADAVTSGGVKFCKLFGMTRVKESDHDSTLFEVSLLPPKFRITSKPTKILYDYYSRKYEEVKDFLGIERRMDWS